MTTDISTNTNRENKNTLSTGMLLIGLGILGIIAPNLSTIVVETWIAVLLSSAGFAKLVYAFQTREQEGFIWKLLLSILYIATGVMLFINPLTGVVTLTLLLGSFLLTEGIFELILAFRLRGRSNWTWALGNAIITLSLAAIVLLEWPFNAPWLIGTIVGASVVVTGISRLMLSFNGNYSLNSSDRPISET